MRLRCGALAQVTTFSTSLRVEIVNLGERRRGLGGEAVAAAAGGLEERLRVGERLLARAGIPPPGAWAACRPVVVPRGDVSHPRDM
jgi:hypothetical protein